MKIASTTGDFRTLPNDDHLERVRHIAKAGFKYVDLSFYSIDKDNSPFMSNYWKNYAQQLIDLSNELGVNYVQAHLPNCNPLDEENFEDYCKCTIRSIEVCGMLGIKNAVIHVGWKDGITKEQFFKMNFEVLKPLFPAMEKNNVNVLIENSAKANMQEKYYFFTGNDMKEFIDYVSHPLIKACWDTGHANIEGHQYEDILALGTDLYAIHVHDNNGIADEHQAPFSGTLNMDEVLTALIEIGYKGYFTFEADSTASFGKTWLLNRHTFDKDTRLFNPPTAVYDSSEKYLFDIGKACLEAYGIYED